MAKFIGTLGVVTGYFETTIDGVQSGVFKPIIETYTVSGDILSNSHRNEQGRSINDNLSISNRFSIIATPSLLTVMTSNPSESNITPMFLEIYGNKWKVASLELQLPRVYISLGGLWNEETN